MHSFPQHLIAGYAAFIHGPYAEAEGRYKKLAKDGQSPTTMIICCCDSRAAPETIFDAGPGELFVVVGSAGYLEVAINQGSAAKTLGCEAGAPVELTFL